MSYPLSFSKLEDIYRAYLDDKYGAAAEELFDALAEDIYKLAFEGATHYQYRFPEKTNPEYIDYVSARLKELPRSPDIEITLNYITMSHPQVRCSASIAIDWSLLGKNQKKNESFLKEYDSKWIE